MARVRVQFGWIKIELAWSGYLHRIRHLESNNDTKIIRWSLQPADHDSIEKLWDELGRKTKLSKIQERSVEMITIRVEVGTQIQWETRRKNAVINI